MSTTRLAHAHTLPAATLSIDDELAAPGITAQERRAIAQARIALAASYVQATPRRRAVWRPRSGRPQCRCPGRHFLNQCPASVLGRKAMP